MAHVPGRVARNATTRLFEKVWVTKVGIHKSTAQKVRDSLRGPGPSLSVGKRGKGYGVFFLRRR